MARFVLLSALLASSVIACGSSGDAPSESSSAASTEDQALDAEDRLIACAKRRGNTGGKDLFTIESSRNEIVFQNTAGGYEVHRIEAPSVRGGKLTVKYDDGVAETVVVDLSAKTALWYEDSDPRGAETYTDCTSMDTYNAPALREWLATLPF
jgi:hypothetical protein